MAVLGTKFNAQDHDTTQREFSDPPNGIYKLEIEASSVENTSAGTGTILKTTVSVIAPEDYKGQKIFNNNYNLENQSAKAQEIGQKQFASLCRAIGISEVEDSEELHFREFTAKVMKGKPSTGKDGKEYPGRAGISRYYFPDEGDLPEPEIFADQPRPAPANDNKRTAANDNRQATTTAAAKPAGSKPWSIKK